MTEIVIIFYQLGPGSGLHPHHTITHHPQFGVSMFALFGGLRGLDSTPLMGPGQWFRMVSGCPGAAGPAGQI